MDKPIYRHRDLDLNASYASVKALAALLGMPSSWCVDPGRLEDAVGSTVHLLDKHGMLQERNSVVLDTSAPCCHGLIGIFGRRFVQSLDARLVLLDVNVVDMGDRVLISHWALSLGASEPAAQDDEEEAPLFV